MIDWEKKKITCLLPLRGKEEDFVSCNREIALRILNQQCSKYSKDKETKETVVKALKKLFDNNFACLFSELTESQQQQILSKLI